LCFNPTVPVEKIMKTFAATTQNTASIVYGLKANQTLKSPNPALNIRRRKEAVATDSLFADVPAVNTPGYTGAQTFGGRSSLLTDCYGFCSGSEFPNTLLDNIRERGAMDTLISDHANYEMSARVKDILRSLMIGHWKSEPYYQHQNLLNIDGAMSSRTLNGLWHSLMSIQTAGYSHSTMYAV